MFCMNCGTKLPDSAKFCLNCGASVIAPKTTTQAVKSVQLRCKSCNGVMEVSEDRPIIMCPFCGSKELILEGDKVTVQRIKSKAYKDVELGKQQIYKEVELGKKELDLKNDDSRFKRVLISLAILLVGALIIYWSIKGASLGGLLAGFVINLAGIVALKNSSTPKEHTKQTKKVTTQADVEMAKIKAKKWSDMLPFIIPFIMWLICMGILLLMPDGG